MPHIIIHYARIVNFTHSSYLFNRIKRIHPLPISIDYLGIPYTHTHTHTLVCRSKPTSNPANQKDSVLCVSANTNRKQSACHRDTISTADGVMSEFPIHDFQRLIPLVYYVYCLSRI